MGQFLQIHGHGHKGGKQEDPLHESDYMVTLDQRPEDAEIGGKEKAVADHQHDADGHRLGNAVAMGADGVQHQHDHTEKTDSHAAGLFQRNGLFQRDGGKEHREDGCGGTDDGGIERRCVFAGFQVGELGEEEAQHRGDEDAAKVLERHLLLGQK